MRDKRSVSFTEEGLVIADVSEERRLLEHTSHVIGCRAVESRGFPAPLCVLRSPCFTFCGFELRSCFEMQNEQ